MAKGEPRKRATDPVVAEDTKAALTREKLAGAIRTLVAMAACWELRDDDSTVTDTKQAKRLQEIVGLLQKAADAQTESAENILSTLMRDELAVAMGAPSEQIIDAIATQGPDAGTRTQHRWAPDCRVPPLPANTQMEGFREVMLDRWSKTPGLAHTLWSKAHHNVVDPVVGDLLASAIRRCHWAVKFILAKKEPAMDPVKSVALANRIREHHREEKQGVMEAASLALHLFRTRDRLDDGSAVKLAAKVLHNKISGYLKNERHPDRPGLASDAVDTGRFFGARDRVANPGTLVANIAPIEQAAVEILGDALGIHGQAREQLWQSINNAEWPGMLTPSSRGAGFRVGAHGIEAVLPDLEADLERKGS